MSHFFVLPPELFNLLFVCIVVCMLVWFFKVVDDFSKVIRLRAAIRENEVSFVPCLGERIHAFNLASPAHFRSLANTQQPVDPQRCPQVVLPFRLDPSSLRVSVIPTLDVPSGGKGSIRIGSNNGDDDDDDYNTTFQALRVRFKFKTTSIPCSVQAVVGLKPRSLQTRAAAAVATAQKRRDRSPYEPFVSSTLARDHDRSATSLLQSNTPPSTLGDLPALVEESEEGGRDDDAGDDDSDDEGGFQVRLARRRRGRGGFEALHNPHGEEGASASSSSSSVGSSSSSSSSVGGGSGSRNEGNGGSGDTIRSISQSSPLHVEADQPPARPLPPPPSFSMRTTTEPPITALAGPTTPLHPPRLAADFMALSRARVYRRVTGTKTFSRGRGSKSVHTKNKEGGFSGGGTDNKGSVADDDDCADDDCADDDDNDDDDDSELFDSEVLLSRVQLEALTASHASPQSSLPPRYHLCLVFKPVNEEAEPSRSTRGGSSVFSHRWMKGFRNEGGGRQVQDDEEEEEEEEKAHDSREPSSSSSSLPPSSPAFASTVASSSSPVGSGSSSSAPAMELGGGSNGLSSLLNHTLHSAAAAATRVKGARRTQYRRAPTAVPKTTTATDSIEMTSPSSSLASHGQLPPPPPSSSLSPLSPSSSLVDNEPRTLGGLAKSGGGSEGGDVDSVFGLDRIGDNDSGEALVSHVVVVDLCRAPNLPDGGGGGGTALPVANAHCSVEDALKDDNAQSLENKNQSNTNFTVGCVVVLGGLSSEAYNGCEGVVVGPKNGNGRYAVRISMQKLAKRIHSAAAAAEEEEEEEEAADFDDGGDKDGGDKDRAAPVLIKEENLTMATTKLKLKTALKGLAYETAKGEVGTNATEEAMPVATRILSILNVTTRDLFTSGSIFGLRDGHNARGDGDDDTDHRSGGGDPSATPSSPAERGTLTKRDEGERAAPTKATATAAATTASKAAMLSGLCEECVVCLTELKDVVLLPCRHLCVCRACLAHLSDKCPVCRAAFHTHVVFQNQEVEGATQRDNDDKGNGDDDKSERVGSILVSGEEATWRNGPVPPWCEEELEEEEEEVGASQLNPLHRHSLLHGGALTNSGVYSRASLQEGMGSDDIGDIDL